MKVKGGAMKKLLGVACAVLALGVVCLGSSLDLYLLQMANCLQEFSEIGKQAAEGELGFHEASQRLREISLKADLVFYNAALAVRENGTNFQKLYIIAASSLSLRLGYEGFVEMDEEKLEAASKLMEFVLELTEEFEHKPLG